MARLRWVAGLTATAVATAACAVGPSPVTTSVATPSRPSAESSTTEPSATTAPILATDAEEMDARYEAALPRFAYDANEPLEIMRQPAFTRTGLVRDVLEYDSPMGGRVPAYLIYPEAEGRYPGLILMHGSGGSRDDLRDQGYDYAGLGVIVLLISAPPARTDPPGPFITLTPADADDQIQLIVDLRRAVDVLVEVGADADRIGYLGYSYGAAMGAGLAGVEPRIRAYVLDVGDGGLVTHLTGADDAGGGPLAALTPAEREAWLAAMEPIEPIYFVRHAEASALLLQSGRFDELVPVADAERLHEAATEPKTVVWYDSGHGLPEQAWCDGAEFLREHLEFDEGPLLPSCG
jgi:dienelactone hydrolase